MSTTSIISVKEMIEKSFGSDNCNWVNFKLVQSTLFFLARQLRVLERQVVVDIPPEMLHSTSTSITATEIQVGEKKNKSTAKFSSKAQRVVNMATTAKQEVNIVLDKKASVFDTKAIQHKTSFTSDRKSVSEYTVAVEDDIKSNENTARDKKVKKSHMNKSESIHNMKLAADNTFAFLRKSISDNTNLLKETSTVSDIMTEEKKKFYELLDKLEEQRELVLRVIHQRHDSHDAKFATPTPMASMERTELEYQKLLILESISPEDVDSRSKQPRLSIVTPQEFKALEQAVKELQAKLETESPDFPENMKMMAELRKGGASLTDAMSALQLSHRLQAAEKAIANLTQMLTDLAEGDDIGLRSSHTSLHPSNATSTHKFSRKLRTHKTPADLASSGHHETNNNLVTHSELRSILDELSTEIYSRVTQDIEEISQGARRANELAKKMENNMRHTAEMNFRMNELKSSVDSYVSRLTSLDSGFSTQMSIYQEQLSQMQMDLEAGLEAVSAAMANKGGDTEVSTELTNCIKSIQEQLDRSLQDQRELFTMQEEFGMNVQYIHKEIELLRDTKADRDEVEDAFRDKAGLEHLNGLIGQDEFYAYIGEFTKKLKDINDRGHARELMWQTALEDFERLLHVKTDAIVVQALRDDIQEKLQKLKNELVALAEIIGEPKAAAVTRKLHKDAVCISCNKPAYMDMEENGYYKPPMKGVNKIPPGDNAHISQTNRLNSVISGHGDQAVVTPTPQDVKVQSVKVCSRYCGGSHTKMNNVTISRPPAACQMDPNRETKYIKGTDGKFYNVDEEIRLLEPCIPCNLIKKPEKVKAPKEKVKKEELPEVDSFFSGGGPHFYDDLSSYGPRPSFKASSCGSACINDAPVESSLRGTSHEARESSIHTSLRRSSDDVSKKNQASHKESSHETLADSSHENPKETHQETPSRSCDCYRKVPCAATASVKAVKSEEYATVISLNDKTITLDDLQIEKQRKVSSESKLKKNTSIRKSVEEEYDKLFDEEGEFEIEIIKPAKKQNPKLDKTDKRDSESLNDLKEQEKIIAEKKRVSVQIQEEEKYSESTIITDESPVIMSKAQRVLSAEVDSKTDFLFDFEK